MVVAQLTFVLMLTLILEFHTPSNSLSTIALYRETTYASAQHRPSATPFSICILPLSPCSPISLLPDRRQASAPRRPPQSSPDPGRSTSSWHYRSFEPRDRRPGLHKKVIWLSCHSLSCEAYRSLPCSQMQMSRRRACQYRRVQRSRRR